MEKHGDYEQQHTTWIKYYSHFLHLHFGRVLVSFHNRQIKIGTTDNNNNIIITYKLINNPEGEPGFTCLTLEDIETRVTDSGANVLSTSTAPKCQ